VSTDNNPVSTNTTTAPVTWVWELLNPAERRHRLRTLHHWTMWLRATYHLEASIPACWYRHTPILRHLTALYAAWQQTYRGEDAPRTLALPDWHNALWKVVDRISRHTPASCLDGQHTDRPIPHPDRQTDEDLTAFLTGPWGTAAPSAPEAPQLPKPEPQATSADSSPPRLPTATSRDSNSP
jgi:hypothetical protein